MDLKNNSFSTVSGNSLDLLSSKIRPADENSLSTAVDVGGGVKYFFANLFPGNKLSEQKTGSCVYHGKSNFFGFGCLFVILSCGLVSAP